MGERYVSGYKKLKPSDARCKVENGKAISYEFNVIWEELLRRDGNPIRMFGGPNDDFDFSKIIAHMGTSEFSDLLDDYKNYLDKEIQNKRVEIEKLEKKHQEEEEKYWWLNPSGLAVVILFWGLSRIFPNIFIQMLTTLSFVVVPLALIQIDIVLTNPYKNKKKKLTFELEKIKENLKKHKFLYGKNREYINFKFNQENRDIKFVSRSKGPNEIIKTSQNNSNSLSNDNLDECNVTYEVNSKSLR